MASVLDDEVFITWAPSWGGGTIMLSGFSPFSASVWYGYADDGETYTWRISVCGLKFKKGYASEDDAKYHAMRLLRAFLTKGLAHLDKHEGEAKVQKEKQEALNNAKKRRRPKPLEES